MDDGGTGVYGHSSWTCRAEERQLSDVLIPVYIRNNNKDLSQTETPAATGDAPVLLEQTGDDSPCVLTLRCGPRPTALICSLLVTSGARTMEVYSQTGDYCGTCRGERDDDASQPDSENGGPFYRKHLVLDSPTTSCEVKLLSLGGRSSVPVSRILLGLQLEESPADHTAGPGFGPSIDMQRVQTLVEEMGTSLSPGAQNLMEMVHFQQKNQASSLSGLLPCLMGGGALALLSRGAQGRAASNGSLSAHSTTPSGATPTPPEPDLHGQNGVHLSDECDSSSSSSPGSLPSLPAHLLKDRSNENPGPVNHTHLAEMMSRFLNGQVPREGRGDAQSSTSDFLPMLQSVCSQVTQLRLDTTAAAKEAELKAANGAWELNQAMEERLGEMERRLKEHIDHRMDLLEQRLEKAFLSALPLLSLQQSSAEGARAPTSLPGADQALHTAQTQALT